MDFDGREGADFNEGENDIDSIEAGVAADTVDGGAGVDEMEADGGNDIVDCGAGAVIQLRPAEAS